MCMYILLFIANEIMIRFDEKLHASMKTSDSCLLLLFFFYSYAGDTSWSFELKCLMCVNLCNVLQLLLPMLSNDFLAESKAPIECFSLGLMTSVSSTYRFVSIFSMFLSYHSICMQRTQTYTRSFALTNMSIAQGKNTHSDLIYRYTILFLMNSRYSTSFNSSTIWMQCSKAKNMNSVMMRPTPPNTFTHCIYKI